MLYLSNRAEETAHVQGKGDSPLLEHTNLKPLAPSRSLDRISISRSRQVRLDWDSLIGTGAAPYAKGWGTEYVKQELEARWDLVGGPKSDADALRISDTYCHSIDPPLVIFSAPGIDRPYLVVLEANEHGMPPYDRPVFRTVVEYNMFWSLVRFVHNGTTERSQMYTVDLAPAVIYRQYREIKALEGLANALAENADQLAQQKLTYFPSADEIASRIDGFLRMRSLQTDVQTKFERLRDRAHDLGYYLPLQQEPFKFPDGTTETLEAGQLYQPYRTEVTWQTRQYKRALVRTTGAFGLFSSSWIIQIPYYAQHSQSVIKHKKVIPDFDPWVEAEQELLSAGFNVFRFERIGTQYVTIAGDTIESIAERCELDIEFGKQCAVMIPVYDQSLVKGEILSRYIVIKCPRKGIQPLHFPTLFIEEDLLFSTHYSGVEVGELIESINLAPGEQREINIEKSTQTEREERRTATSISDLTQSDTIDLSTEMEKEFSNSNERTSTTSLSAKAGGSYGGFSGSVAGSTSSTQTTKQFARDLQKVANRASRSVTLQTKQEIRTDGSVKTSVSSRQSTKIQIKNINDGRSLNLLFYRLYNIYDVTLTLERMQFTLLSGKEIIAGSGVVVPEVFSVAELPAMLEKLNLDGFPVQPVVSAQTARDAFLKAVLNSIISTLNEYQAGEADSSETIEIPKPFLPAVSISVDSDIRHFAQKLNELKYIPQPITPPGANAPSNNSVVIGSPGLYLDARVGARPATEPYSEQMRGVELDRRMAEVNELESKAAYTDALARRLGRPDPGNVVTGKPITLKHLELVFEKPPNSGNWSLYVSELFIKTFAINDGNITQNVTFTRRQTWLTKTTVDIAKVVHDETKQELYFLI
ncbi:hypothetical protein [Neorhizobium galegae]|uniref:hypothetical protein n=1 Tax=Neorhizobium galegae TaxID=399 RepID=UPI0012772753|nr:hypothetical protein [Neorhizobium galegae]KAA9385721.1 hypothetical protein F4V88_04205 [Neorhizobium galegae]MCM2497338.1 hypothetical protein [Neorhizobium galegae]